jgi:hypothetical protein
MLDAAQKLADPADLGREPGRMDDAGSLPGGDERPRKRKRGPVAQGRVLRHGVDVLGGRHGFAREDRLVDAEVPRPEEPEVGRHPIPRLDEHHVSRHEVGHRHAQPRAVAQDGRLRRDHVADRGERVLGLALLQEADDGVHEDDGEDHPGVDEVTKRGRRRRPRQQEVDERVVELGEEAQERVPPRAGRDRVRPVSSKPFGSFAGTQSPRRRAKIGQARSELREWTASGVGVAGSMSDLGARLGDRRSVSAQGHR